MQSSLVERIVAFCTRHRRPVIGLAAIVTVASAIFIAGHYKINTDTERLLPSNLPWQQHQLAYAATFPPHQIIAIVEAPTAELAEIASERLETRLRQHPDLFLAVRRPQGGEFMERNGLLYLPLDRVTATAERLAAIGPALGPLAADPTLRGVMHALSGGVDAVQNHRIAADTLVRPMAMLSDTLDHLVANRFASLSWRAMLNPDLPDRGGSRQFIEIDPKLDFSAVQPGHAATEAIRQAVADFQFGPQLGARVVLTGRVPMNDEQFAALGPAAIPGFVGTVVAVLLILWLALRSGRIIAAVFATLFVGFAVTTAAGLLLAGAFNLLSIAFAVLFVGLGADFAIQYSVRYRAERHEHDEVAAALHGAARKAGSPLALAAAGTAIGFFSFVPTEYRGLAELGEVAGIGMIAAFVTTITLLPALLSGMKLPPERRPMGFARLAPVDDFFARHRIGIVVGTLAVVLAGSPLLLRMRFDFDPSHLQDQRNEAIMALHQLSTDPELGINAANVIAPSVNALNGLTQRFAAMPEISGTRTVLNLVPDDQPAKIHAIEQAAGTLAPALNRAPAQGAAPTDAETLAAIEQAAADLQRLSVNGTGDGAAAAGRLSADLTRLAAADPTVRVRAEAAIVGPLKRDLDWLRNMLRPQRVTLATLPPEIARDWVAPDGRARVEILPKGDPTDAATTQRFADAVLAVAPDAAGTPIGLVKSKETVLRAFFEAGALAIVAIAAVLWISLRRFSRRTADPGAVAGRRAGDDGTDRAHRRKTELRQHHRPAAAARRRRRVQDVLHHGVARGPHQPAAVDADSGGRVQRRDDRDRVRQPVAVERARHVEHGQIDGARSRLHDGRRGAVPAGPDGPAAGAP